MNDVEEVKQRVDIVDLVGQYVSLKKSGSNFKGLCPFHHERTPSFMVNPERQIFKCFGCNKGGDIFSFIQEMEHVEFGDALRMLADQAGVVLTPRSKPKPGEAPGEKSRYFAINNAAAQVFHKILIDHPSGKKALEYLHNRGVTDETIRQWRIGYAPRKKVLTEFLTNRGFSTKEIEQAGKPDMFYDRIMFPILDVIGNVVGFTGRVLDPGEPKYLNTPETPIFRKSSILFGLDKAKHAIKEHKQVIIAEGQMDVISASQAGTSFIVATSGTALTQDHLRILSRYDVDIIFAFDTDAAGTNATKKAIDMATTDGLSVKIISLPSPYKDIGEIVEKESGLWVKLSKKPIPTIEWFMNIVFQPFQVRGVDRKLSVDEKKRVAKELLPVLKRIPDTIEQAHYVQLLAKRLGVAESTIMQAMSKAPIAKTNATDTTTKRQKLSSEEALLGLLERYKPHRDKHLDLYNRLNSWYSKSTNDLIFAIDDRYRGLSPDELETEIELLVKRYIEKERDTLKADFAKKINEAEEAGDRQRVKQLLSEFQQLIK